MKFKQALLATIIAVLGFIFPVWNWGQTPVAIADAPSAVELSNRNLADGVDQFLHQIPRGYYTIMKVGKAKQLTNGDRALFVDVREPSEYTSGHIKGAINIPLRSLADNLDKIPRDRTVVLYCSTGYRTGIGVASLQLLGYDNVKGFPPSIKGWKEAGETLEK